MTKYVVATVDEIPPGSRKVVEIATGQSWFDPAKTKVKAYPTAVESGEALAKNPELSAAGFQPGPYSGETYEVEVDRDYVIVNI